MEKFNMFEALSKDNKELIHSQFIKYLITYHNEKFYKDFLGIEPLTGDVEVETSFTNGKEKGRFDIIVKDDDTIKLVIENKFKSFPYAEQLEKYDNYFKAAEMSPKRILLTFDNEITESLVGNEDWELKDYSKLLDFCGELPKNNYEDHSLFLSHYVEFLQEYVDKFQKIKTKGLSTIEKENNKNRGFWKSLVYHIVTSKVSLEISNKYAVTVFSGRQFEPGFVIENRNKEVKKGHFLLDGNECWLEYQNGVFKLKFGKSNYDNLRGNDDLKEIAKTNGYSFYNKPRTGVESFSMIKKEIDYKNLDLDAFAKIIVEEFKIFKTKFNL